MIRFKNPSVCCLFLLCVLFSCHDARSQGPGKAEADRFKLVALPGETFEQDPRTTDSVVGEADWEAGSLSLKAGAKFKKEINSGARVRIELSVKPQDYEEGANRETRVWFRSDMATPCFVKVSQSVEKEGSICQVSLFDTTGMEPGAPTQLVKKSLPKQLDVSHLGVEYFHGMVTVRNKEEELLKAYIPNNDAQIASFLIESVKGELPLNRIEVQARPRVQVALSEQQKLELRKSESKILSVNALFQQRRYQEAASALKEAIELKTSILGHGYTQSTNDIQSLGTIYMRLGNYPEALNAFEKTLAIRVESVGEHHPELVGTLHKLGNLNRTLGKLYEAIKIYERCIEMGKLVDERSPQFLTSLNNVSTLYRAVGDFAKAEPLTLRCLKARKEVLGENHPHVGHSWNNLGLLCMDTGRFEDAEKYLLLARKVQKASGRENLNHAATLANLADVYEQLAQYSNAIKCAEEAGRISLPIVGEEHVYYLTSRVSLAGIYHRTGKFGAARIELDKVLGALNRVSEERLTAEYATTMNNVAVLYQEIGEYAKAKLLMDEATRVIQKLHGNRGPRYANTFISYGFYYLNTGNFRMSIDQYQKGLTLIKEIYGEEHTKVATTLSLLGNAFKDASDYTGAEECYKKSLKIREKVQGRKHPDYFTSLNNLGLLYTKMGDFTKAEPLLEQSLRFRGETNGFDSPDYASSLTNLALVFSENDRLQKAIELIEQARQIIKNSGADEQPVYADTLTNLSQVYTKAGRFDQAIAVQEEANQIYAIAYGKSHPKYAIGINNLGSTLDLAGDYKNAENKFREALDIQNKLLGRSHPQLIQSQRNLASHYLRLGRNNESLQYAQAALEGQLELAIRTLPGLSEAQARNWMINRAPRLDLILGQLDPSNAQDARKAYQLIWSTKQMISRLRGGNATGSTDPDVVQIAEELRGTRIQLSNLVTKYSDANGFRDELERTIARKEELEKELGKKNLVSKRELLIRDAKVEQLLGRLPDDAAVVDFFRSAKWEFKEKEIEVKRSDGELETRKVKEAVYHFEYEAFVLRSDRSGGFDISWIPLGKSEPIASAVTNWLSELTNGDRVGTDQPAGEQLRKFVLEPILPKLRGVQTIVFIPDGVLNQVPWPAVPTQETGRYLIQDYAVSTAPYGQQLFGLLDEKMPSAQGRLLLAGGIEYGQPNDNRDGASWGFLDGTQSEVSSLAQLWPDQKDKVHLLTGNAADENTIAEQLIESRFVHLATHGFFDNGGQAFGVDLREKKLFQSSLPNRDSSVAFRNPLLLSGLVFAGANASPQRDASGGSIGGDGILTAEEIAGLDLRNTELVTLSACETGLGHIEFGEGVFGLQRVFHRAGVRGVIASKWRVDDIATRELMKKFYENLWIKKQAKSVALRNAQIWLLKNPRELAKLGVVDPITRGKPRKLKQAEAKPIEERNNDPQTTHPYFWAAFQLSGDWR